jgi:CheY-like chemotaxis protein
MQELAPAAIVLDLVMPEMDGFQVLEHLSQNPRWRDIPVLILTGTDLSASDRARLSQRAADILHKDGSVARNLTSAIARALESR